jgi:hypothetical protein
VLIEVQRGQGAGEWRAAAGAVGRPDLYRRASGNPPGAQEPGSFDRVDALEAARRDCLGLAPVS